MVDLFDDYVQALRFEIRRASEANRTEIETVYFGGGTPTVFSKEQMSSILEAVYDSFIVSPNAEITTEANPGTVDKAKLTGLHSAGFNRISLGVQSLDDDVLHRLGRVHSSQDALQAYFDARTAGFNNIGLDLMFALPTQTLEDWKVTLQKTVNFLPEHISLYELSIEEGTRFAQLYGSKLCRTDGADRSLSHELPDEETKLAMYKATINSLTSAGYEHYEVSNFARPGFRSRHNQVYWRNDPYFGFGAGAVSYIGGIRGTNVSDPREYVSTVLSGRSAVETSESVSVEVSMGESVMLALRTSDGLSRKRFEKRYGVDVTGVFNKEIQALVEAELVFLTDTKLRLTPKGFFLADEIALEFLP